MAQTIEGTANAPASVIASTRVASPGNPPMKFTIAYDQAGSSNPASGRPLERTYWKATELAGKPTPAQDANREAHLMFQAAGRVSGSDGCNRVSGTYQLKGDEVDTGEVERVFREALKGAKRLTISGDRLELFDAAGSRVAVLTASVQVSAPSASPELAGTSWQLVKFQGSDEKTLTPEARSTRSTSLPAAG